MYVHHEISPLISPLVKHCEEIPADWFRTAHSEPQAAMGLPGYSSVVPSDEGVLPFTDDDDDEEDADEDEDQYNVDHLPDFFMT